MLKIITKKQTQEPILKIAYDGGKVLIQEAGGGFSLWHTATDDNLKPSPLVVAERCYMIQYSDPYVLCAQYAAGAMPVVTAVGCYDVTTGEEMWQADVAAGENKAQMDTLKIKSEVAYGNEGLLESYIAEEGSEEWQALAARVPVAQQPRVRLDMEMAETEGKALLIYYLSGQVEGSYTLHLAGLNGEGECLATLAVAEGLKGAAPGNAVITEDNILIQTAIKEICLIEW